MSSSPAPGWASARLDAIAEVRLGRQRSPKNHQGDNMVPYLRAANITWSGVDVTDVKAMNFTQDEVEVYRLSPGDILLSEASGSLAEVGKPGVWRSDLGGDVCFQNTLLRVRPEDGVDSDFLYYRLLHECLRGGFARSARGVGIHHLGSAKLATLAIELPGPAAQRRIAERLSETLDLLDRTRLDAERLRFRAAQLSAAALSDLHRSALAATRGRETPVGDVTTISGGLQKQPTRAVTDTDQGWPFLRVANVGRRVLALDDVHRVRLSEAEQQRTKLLPGDLLVVEGNGSPDQIGRAAMWHGALDPCTHQNHLIRVRPGSQLDPAYLELVWSAPHVLEQLKAVASTTSGLYTLSTRKVGSVQLPIPEKGVQTTLVALARHRLRLADFLLDGLGPVEQRLDALRLSILAAAFREEGAEGTSEESGEELLQRIQSARKRRAVRAQSGRRGTSRRTSTGPVVDLVEESA